LWTVVRWDGFRPRDRSLDAPAVFETELSADSVANEATIDSLLAAHLALVQAEKADSIGRANAAQTRNDTAGSVFTLSFASLLNESAARALAAHIRVDGRPPRVVAGSRDGVTIYRVVLGPYATREAAEAAGRRSGVPYWVFVGLP
jgi:septal ring-binding cell division protein DamX